MSFVPYTFAGDTGSIPLNQLDVNFANVKTSVYTAGYVTANAQANITSVGTLTSLAVSGNTNITGDINAANITGSNLISTGLIRTATTIINSDGISTDFAVSATGDITGANVITSGVVTASGTVTGGNVTVATGGTFTNGELTLTGANLIAAESIILDPNGAGGTTGNVVIAGNLQVQGNTTTFNSTTVTTNDLRINVANNAVTSSAANGGGIGVGPADAEYALLTFSNSLTSWVASIPLSVTGTIIASGNITGANLTLNSTSGNITAHDATLGGNLTLSSATGNVTAHDATLGGNLSVTGTGAFTGIVTAPTAANATSNTQVATTAFVGSAVYNATASLGTMSTQNANAVSVTGGTISGLGTPLAAASGGTGLASAGSSGNVLVSDGSNWKSSSLASSGIKLGLGITGETWQNVTGSRSSGTTYTNSYNYPIAVSAKGTGASSPNITFVVNGVTVSDFNWQFNGAGAHSGGFTIVPPGSTYSLTFNNSGIDFWVELY